MEITMTMQQEKLAYRVNDFCKAIGLSRSTFYKLLSEGKVKTVSIGGRRLVPVCEAERLLNGGAK
ncbi:hypothetical protein CCR94_22035 [Rhodoblastus sphagnicola]|uniref:HTH cro/C1-type domain-containing protein n=2 Tax=Rhodoblastus sphagnicola TaxID=333368 RepID=A0A2S6MWA6_9HYPH|nr:hypothetical protein CCR94_22035 [Rhodoblastus sphagnicola]